MIGHTGLTPAILSSFDDHPSLLLFLALVRFPGSFGFLIVDGVVDEVFELRGVVGAILKV